jgi:hemoglobin
MGAAPTLYEWIGGAETIEHLLSVFYERVPRDPLLGPVLAEITPAHAKHVAAFVAEVFAGPKTYSADSAVTMRWWRATPRGR